MKRLVSLCAAGAIAGGVLLSGQQIPGEPRKQFGASITGSFEGWFYNPDGSRTFLVGYFNRNTTQTLDIPVGPNNRIEPDGPDMGQPAHFLAGRQVGVFAVPVPKDFTPDRQFTWTIVANGQTTSIPFRVKPDYLITPFNHFSVNNTPPVVRFVEKGPAIQGPIAMLANAASRTTSVSAPLALPVWAADDEKYTSGTSAPQRNPPPPVLLTWTKYRGAGTVTFDKAKPEVEKLPGGDAVFNGRATTTARFSQPGEYVLQLTANDYSGPGGGGELCCWTTALVKVSVTP